MNRRELLHNTTYGVGTVALAWLLNQQKLLGEPAKPDLEPHRQHNPERIHSGRVQ